MLFSTWELLDLAGAPRNPWGELRLVWRLLAQRGSESHQIFSVTLRPLEIQLTYVLEPVLGD
jgi:hypothetical protein